MAPLLRLLIDAAKAKIMGEICPFTEEDLTAVSGLYLQGMRGRSNAPGRPLQDYFREIFFANPWASPEFPSLVYRDRGKPVGFLGVIPRRMEFCGRRISVAVATQFTMDREQHRGFGAMELLRCFLRGPQDLSFTDGAGGSGTWASGRLPGMACFRLYSFNWLRILGPPENWRAALAIESKDRWGCWGEVAAARAAPLDFLISKLPHPSLRPPRSACASTPLSAEDLYRCMQEVGWREALKPSYDLPSFQWLMSQVASNRALGDILMAAVHNSAGDLCGYYVCQVKRGGHASVLQIGVRRRDHFDDVLSALFRDAWQRGASSVKGQAIPSALVNLTNQYCLFRQAHTCVLFQAKDPAISDSILRGDAALSRLDGECWLRFSTEPWT